MVIKGQNLRVKIGGKCIALATSCQFHIAANTEDTSTKDSTGDWSESEITGLSWDASTDSLVTLDTDETGEAPVDLMDLIINKTLLDLEFDATNGVKNRTAQNSVLKRSGKAYLTDYSLTAPNRQNSTLSCKFTGTGAIA